MPSSKEIYFTKGHKKGLVGARIKLGYILVITVVVTTIQCYACRKQDLLRRYSILTNRFTIVLKCKIHMYIVHM